MAESPRRKFKIITRRRMKWLGVFLLGVILSMGIIYGSIASTTGTPATDYAFFKQVSSHNSLVIAHRGGAGIAPENTLYAFEQSAKLGVDVLEMDVRATSDGTLVVLHDAKVDRTTSGTGLVSEMSLEALKKLDAGYRWSPDGGQTFPMREKGITVPTLKEVFTALPNMRFNIEPKPGTTSIIKPLCQMIREHNLTERVVIGSFNQAILDEFRRECTGIATSAGPSEVGKFLTMYKTGLSQSYSPTMQALQIPENIGVQIVDKGFIEAAHERNLQVHVWTVNKTEDMQRLLDAGVDGIMTDYPDRLLNLLGRTSAK